MNGGSVRTGLVTAGGLALLALPSCARVDVQPIEVKPIHLTVDVNIRVDRQLDEFFDFERRLDPDQADRSRPPAETTQPAAPAVVVTPVPAATTRPATMPATAPTTAPTAEATRQDELDSQPLPIPPVPPSTGKSGT